MVAAGDADLSMWDTPGTMPVLDSGKVVVLGGVHAGCIEVFGTDRVRALHDIKGKTAAITAYGTLVTFSSRAWRRISASIRAPTSAGFPWVWAQMPSKRSPKARRMLSWRFRLSRKSCAPKG